MKKILLLVLLIIICQADSCFAEINLSKDDRVIIFAPHPDDEVIALGGIIQKILKAGAKLKIVYLTNGEYNEINYFFYKKHAAMSTAGFINIGETRQKEAYNAMKYLEVNNDDLIFLGYPDRFTETILTGFWDKKWPAASMLTHIKKVPYKNALSPGALYIGESVLSDIKKVLNDFKPTIVFTSSPKDTNPDHRSLYVFVNTALFELKDKFIPREQYSYLVHKVGWPKAKKYLPSFELDPPPEYGTANVIWNKVPLSEDEVKNKYKALLLYKSQLSMGSSYLLSFVRANELLSSYSFVDTRAAIETQSSEKDSEMISEITYSRDEEFLYINILFNKKIARGIKADMYFLGYKSDKDFSLMPKIFFKVKDGSIITYDKRKRIYIDNLKATSRGNTITIKFPLKALDNPQYVFSRMILKGKVLAVYASAWRILQL
ncbi:MAG: PIG-L family deacetylase [Candidatus Omnitrophota bacterium]